MRWKTLKSGRNLYQLRTCCRDMMSKAESAEDDLIDSRAQRMGFFSEREAWRFAMHFLHDSLNRPILLSFLCDEFRHQASFDIVNNQDDEWLAEVVAWSIEHDDIRIYVLEEEFRFPILPEKKPPLPLPPPMVNPLTWVEVQAVWDDSGKPVKYLPVVIQSIDGRTNMRRTDDEGVIKIEPVENGACEARCSFQGITLADCVTFAGIGPVMDPNPKPSRIAESSPPQAVVQVETHKVKAGETLDSVAKQAGLKWQDLAFFNWGTKEPEEINKHLAEDVGCTKKTADGKNYLFDGSDSPGIVYVPKQWKLPGLGTSQRHVIRVKPFALGKVRVRIFVTPETAAERDEHFRLFSEDGAYDQVKTAADDTTPGDGFVDLVFAGVPIYSRYSFEISLKGEKPETVLKDVAFEEINQNAGVNKDKEPENHVMCLLDESPQDVEPPQPQANTAVLNVGLPTEIRLLDDELSQLANRRYRLVIDGEQYEGRLDEKGRLIRKLPNNAKSGKITVWFDDDDENIDNNSAMEMEIDFESESKSEADDEGALLRLVNLGYYHGEDPSATCPEAVDAIARFQREHELPITGKLDDDTRSKLKEAYGC